MAMAAPECPPGRVGVGRHRGRQATSAVGEGPEGAGVRAAPAVGSASPVRLARSPDGWDDVR